MEEIKKIYIQMVTELKTTKNYDEYREVFFKYVDSVSLETLQGGGLNDEEKKRLYDFDISSLPTVEDIENASGTINGEVAKVIMPGTIKGTAIFTLEEGVWKYDDFMSQMEGYSEEIAI